MLPELLLVDDVASHDPAAQTTVQVAAECPQSVGTSPPAQLQYPEAPETMVVEQSLSFCGSAGPFPLQVDVWCQPSQAPSPAPPPPDEVPPDESAPEEVALEPDELLELLDDELVDPPVGSLLEQAAMVKQNVRIKVRMMSSRSKCLRWRTWAR